MEREAITEALRQAGERGLTRSRLAKALGGLPTIEDWLRDRRVVNVGTAKTPRYVLPENDRRMERACEVILARATPGKASVFNAAKLRKGAPKAVADEAIASLVERRELFVVQPGKTLYYLHARSIAPLMSQEAPAAFSLDRVRDDYHALVREGGFADIRIDHLARRSGAPLDDLKAWLLAESRAGRAAPTRGDWSLADAGARAAAIDIRGEPHLQIRLL